jgi:hypothetical protein
LYPGRYFNARITFYNSETKLGTVRTNNVNNKVERTFDFSVDIAGAGSLTNFAQVLDRIYEVSDTGILEKLPARYISNIDDILKYEKTVMYRGTNYKYYDFRRY